MWGSRLLVEKQEGDRSVAPTGGLQLYRGIVSGGMWEVSVVTGARFLGFARNDMWGALRWVWDDVWVRGGRGEWVPAKAGMMRG